MGTRRAWRAWCSRAGCPAIRPLADPPGKQKQRTEEEGNDALLPKSPKVQRVEEEDPKVRPAGPACRPARDRT